MVLGPTLPPGFPAVVQWQTIIQLSSCMGFVPSCQCDHGVPQLNPLSLDESFDIVGLSMGCSIWSEEELAAGKLDPVSGEDDNDTFADTFALVSSETLRC